MTDEPNIKNDDRLAGDLIWLRDMAKLHGWEIVGRAADRIEAQNAELAALRQRCEQAERRLNEASHDAIYEAHRREQAERERDGLRRDAERWRAWREAQQRIESELPEGYAIELYCSPGDWSISLYDRTGKDLEIVDFDSTEDFVRRAIEMAKEHAAALAHDAQGAANE